MCHTLYFLYLHQKNPIKQGLLRGRYHYLIGELVLSGEGGSDSLSETGAAFSSPTFPAKVMKGDLPALIFILFLHTHTHTHTSETHKLCLKSSSSHSVPYPEGPPLQRSEAGLDHGSTSTYQSPSFRMIHDAPETVPSALGPLPPRPPSVACSEIQVGGA